MQWIEIIIKTTEEASDAICEMLAQLGADGIAVSDPYEIKRIIDEPGSLAYADEGYVDSLGTDVTVKGYFAELDDGLIRMGAKNDEYIDPDGIGMIYGNITDKSLKVDEAIAELKRRLDEIGEFLDVGEGFLSYSYVKDEDWANNWKADYKSFRISDRVVICPSWEDTEFAPEDIVVRLDPGSAFGTGTHETTSMCAEFIDRYMEELGDGKLLDLGTGSGILAIIARKLGASDVEAIDIDKLAVDVAIENCEINGCGDIKCHTGELKDAYEGSYKMIIANIIADVIAMIVPDVKAHMNEDSIFICSGIINTKADRVGKALSDNGMRIIEENEKNDWIAMVVARQ
ncbi:ribosomal protein L11 methyltransferase [Ruminococcaceae bacterium YRB3002]|nr:ribosomal protein L11 methyltransferase [Ruminococcaceae bacterium YRB3002]